MEKRSWGDIEEEKLNEGIVRKMIWGEKVMVVRFELGPNISIQTHKHISEQITMVQKGTVILSFPEGREVTLGEGDMLVIPSSVPHGGTSGPHGCVVNDVFSPIREDFIKGTATYFNSTDEVTDPTGRQAHEEEGTEETYRLLHEILREAGIEADLEQVKDVPVDILAHYIFEKEMASMGRLRRALGMDKSQAKALLREWKHGDDHSESSYQKMKRTMVILPWEKVPS
jgi:quercetin dioxygenase-like cupin family protein